MYVKVKIVQEMNDASYGNHTQAKELIIHPFIQAIPQYLIFLLLCFMPLFREINTSMLNLPSSSLGVCKIRIKTMTQYEESSTGKF